MLVKEYYGTEEYEGKRTVTDEERSGLCYVLAGYALSAGRTPAGAIMVHGTISGFGNPRIGHAWLMIEEDLVWEPMQARLWPALIWNAVANPEVGAEYDRAEAAEAMLEHGTWGPWHE